MLCPKCKTSTTFVLRTKQDETGAVVRRQRQCTDPKCKHRFWTSER